MSVSTAGFRCPLGFKNYPSDLLGSTDILTPTATRSGSEDGRKPVLGAVNPDSMKDSETQRQECTESIDFSGLGKELLQSRLERDATDLSARLFALSKIAGEDEFGGSEVEELYRLHTQLTETIRMVERYSPFDGNLKAEPFDGGVTDE